MEDTKKDTRTASLEALRKMQDRGELHATREDAPAIDVPDGFWEAAQLQEPKAKQQVNLRVDPDVLAFFKAQGKGHLTKMHAVLRSYVDAQRGRHTKT